MRSRFPIADKDGVWHDATSEATGASRYINGVTGRLDWEIRNVAGDGKFDENEPLSSLEAGIGRIDFSKMIGFHNPVLDGAGDQGAKNREVRLTKDYLLKALAWRTSLQAAGTIPTPLGVAPQPANVTHCFAGGENYGRALPSQGIFTRARSSITASTRQNNGLIPSTGIRDLFLPDTVPPNQFAAWGVHCNFGANNGINDWTGNSWNSSEELFFAAKKVHAAFCILWGSYLGDWNREPENLFGNVLAVPPYIKMSAGNFQKAILAQPMVANQPITGLVVFSERLYDRLDLSRAATGFPIGCAVVDSVGNFSVRTRGILGDPTLISR